ncbi:nitroreductase/quinone reductase family protein [Actinoplanes sp. NPDC049265]|uniref:nitroreductase/quinone reductase family protein n=1 Tax=Actinoplanes sp. NPDC049265 TaxID=3363902 RepID=UPI0037235E0D
METIGVREPGRIRRWMYRSGRPNRLAAALNRVTVWAGETGWFRSRLITLEVRGRRTGRPITLPLVPVVHDGHRYLVAMLGERTGWVANVRAAGGRAVIRSGGWECVRLVEVEPELRPPILAAYLRVAPGARPHIPVDRHADPAAFAAIAAGVPVFQICADHGVADPS